MMKIELMIENKKQTFTVPFTPLLARRKYYELMAELEAKNGEVEPTPKDILEEDDELYSILSDVVFQKQFTLENLYAGASKEYLDGKLREAIFGTKPKKESEEGNETGE